MRLWVELGYLDHEIPSKEELPTRAMKTQQGIFGFRIGYDSVVSLTALEAQRPTPYV